MKRSKEGRLLLPSRLPHLPRMIRPVGEEAVRSIWNLDGSPGADLALTCRPLPHQMMDKGFRFLWTRGTCVVGKKDRSSACTGGDPDPALARVSMYVL